MLHVECRRMTGLFLGVLSAFWHKIFRPPRTLFRTFLFDRLGLFFYISFFGENFCSFQLLPGILEHAIGSAIYGVHGRHPGKDRMQPTN